LSLAFLFSTAVSLGATLLLLISAAGIFGPTLFFIPLIV
jgi:hypothetical protein